jgi:hypothetical protein
MILLASEMDNRVPQDAAWIAKRLQLTTVPDFEALISIGFIESYDDASNLLATCYKNGGTEAEEEESREELELLPERPRKQRAARSGDVSRETWLTPIIAAWEAPPPVGNGPGTFPKFGRAAAALAPLRKAGFTDTEIAYRLAWYLEMRGDRQGHMKAPGKRGYPNWVPTLEAFVPTFGYWDRNAPEENP